MNNFCPSCGAPVAAGAMKCEYCGASIAQAAPQQPVAPVQPQPQNVVYVQNNLPDPRAGWPVKNKVAAGVLALLLGGIGVHKFYLGRGSAGVLCLLFCWTGIPAIIGLIDGIGILTSSDEVFMQKYHCRIG